MNPRYATSLLCVTLGNVIERLTYCVVPEGHERACSLHSLLLLAQDAIKKGSKDELPDFYNIVLERPRDDPTGYDCLFIDAASKVPSPRTVSVGLVLHVKYLV